MATVSIMSKGYGIVPKLVMADRRMGALSKSIYSYIVSFAGNKETAFPSRDKICADLLINKNTFTKYIKPLIQYGYISVLKRRTNGGRYSGNLYVVLQEVDYVEPCPTMPDTVEVDDNNNSNINNNNDRSHAKKQKKNNNQQLISKSVIKKLKRDAGATHEQVQEAIERVRKASNNKTIHNFIGYTKTTLESIVVGCKPLPDTAYNDDLPNKRLELIQKLYC